MRKLAVNSLNITVEEYQLLREEKGEDWVIDEIERRSSEKAIATYNLRSLKDSLLTDQSVAARTHMEWQPSEVRALFSSPYRAFSLTYPAAILVQIFAANIV